MGVSLSQYESNWRDCVRQIRAMFVQQVGEQVVAERFDIPSDYSEYMQSTGGGLRWGELILYTAPVVASATTGQYQSFVIEREEEDSPQDEGFWLTIGWYADKHEKLLCCDRSHDYYGQIISGHDDHPWLNGISSGGIWVIATSFSEYLRQVLDPTPKID